MHTSTYRIQFNSSFPFRKLQRYVEYLDLLGIDTLYASPVFCATPGSMHGYDVTNPHHFNPELGSPEVFENLSHLLKEQQIGWLQDIVPNHMAFNAHNRWLWDVLEYGRESSYAPVFDIDWDHPEFMGKLMVPFLGKSFREAVMDGEISLVYSGGIFNFSYFDTLYPVNKEGFKKILTFNAGELPEELIPFIETGDSGTGPDRKTGSPGEQVKEEIEKLYQTSPAFRQWIADRLQNFMADPSNMIFLHDMQHYCLCYWKQTEEKINYRRFFTVNGLICLRMEDPRVFDRYHTFLKTLLDNKKFDGLRVDHIDGLKDPGQYLDRLRRMIGKDPYLIVEKILELKENLPVEWKVQGTTGYEFLAVVNNLLTNEQQYPVLSELYDTILPGNQNLTEVILKKKRFILFERMKGELENLFRELYSSALIPEIRLRDAEPGKIRKALAEILIGVPVYRLYGASIPLDTTNASVLKKNVENAINREPSLEKELRLLLDLFLDGFGGDMAMNDRILDFFKRCMQFTGPLMAKGVEDTTMYYYHQFIAHNEVGDNPGAHGFTISEFHEAMLTRQKSWPTAMNATATHDTKRGEDVRARLNVISDRASEWKDLVETWFRMNARHKKMVNGKEVPTRNEEYLIYQTLTGVWPFEGNPDESLKNRLEEYLIKAMREAKTHTTWNEPEEEHEETVINFMFRLLDPDAEFYRSFNDFQNRISRFGILNSLVQVILKMTCPGIPDIYQGTEMWDFSLVDPDNRRPVDYERRWKRLTEMIGRSGSGDMYREMTDDLFSGEMKLWQSHVLLRERKSDPELFLEGEYIPVRITGQQRDKFLAFFRKYGSRWLLVVVPLHLAAMNRDWGSLVSGKMSWADAEIPLPGWCSGQCFDILVRRKISLNDSLKLDKVFHYLPLIVLRSS
jgi:(1->4)-alpha-D-glucan 1-alpha-D-glucosylmutase